MLQQSAVVAAPIPWINKAGLNRLIGTVPMTAQILFALADTIDGLEISPSAVPISVLTEFSKDVAKFVVGSAQEIRKNDVIVSIENGSLGLAVAKAILELTLVSELINVETNRDVGLIDHARAEVLLKWQRQARGTHRHMTIAEIEGGTKTILLKIGKETHLTNRDVEPWAATEKYLQGIVQDSGGSSAVNIHLRVGDTTYPVAAKQEQIRSQEKNHVYHEVLLRVSAEQNLVTGALRNIKLIDFVDYAPSFDAAEFEALTKKGAAAWKDVDDVSEWLQSIRGS